MIEVIDVAAKRVIARQAINGYISDVLSDGRAVTYVENDDGVPIATVWTLGLKQ